MIVYVALNITLSPHKVLNDGIQSKHKRSLDGPSRAKMSDTSPLEKDN